MKKNQTTIFRKFNFIILSFFIVILSLCLISCNLDNTEDKYDILKKFYGKDLEDPQVIIIECLDNSWEYEGSVHSLFLDPNPPPISTASSMISPLLENKMQEHTNADVFYRIEITSGFWDIKYDSLENVSQEVKELFYEKYEAFFAYHNANLLTNYTQVVFIIENEKERPYKIIGLWTKDQINNFKSNCNKVFAGMDGYMSIHLTIKQ